MRSNGISPSQVEIIFSLRDELGRSIVLPAQELRAATRVFERGPETLGLEEIDYAETNFFIHTAENLELEVVFVLDFTSSMARAQLSDGQSGIEAMLEAFEESARSLPAAHRVGVVEFHDRNVEPAVLSELTTDRDAMLESVSAFAGSAFDSGSSRVWDSIHVASTLFTTVQDGPFLARALVFISDGRDTSSQRTRDIAGTIATQGDIQLYALGIGEVYEEVQLSEMVRDTGGVYYAARELEALREQLEVLVGDLRGQYRLTYTTLRREGLYETGVQVDLPWATGSFLTPALEVASYFGLDTQGRLAVDPPAIDTDAATAQVFIRAEYVPRNIGRFRFRLETAKPVKIELVPRQDGGLISGWELSGPDVRGFHNAIGPQPVEFGNSGLLFKITLSEFTEPRLEVPLVLDNGIYTAGKSFSYPAVIHFGQRVEPSGHIVFRTNRDGNSDIYGMNFDGSDLRNLTSSGSEEFLATWSPDGLRLAFDSFQVRNRDIFVMDADGTDVRRLTGGTGDNSLPAWSPDGLRIAFDSDRDGNREIYVMNADGAGQTRLTNDDGSDLWPAWSPDSSEILFVSDRDGNREVYVMNADGTGQTNLTNHPSADLRPVWSPDGRSIVFYSVRDGNREVYLMNSDGTGQRNLTNYPASDDWYPSWSPSGAHIAFMSLRDGNRETYEMYSDGTDVTNLTNNPSDDSAPAWGP